MDKRTLNGQGDVQVEKRVLCILAIFWLALAGLLNERFSGTKLRPYEFESCLTQNDVYSFQTNLATIEENVIMSSEHSFLTMKEDMQLFVHLEYFRHANTSTRA